MMITISAETLYEYRGHDHVLPIQLRCQDGGDAYSAISTQDGAELVPGSVIVTTRSSNVDFENIGKADDQVRVVAQWQETPGSAPTADVNTAGRWCATGYVRCAGQWEQAPVTLVPIKDELFSRMRGILESGVLADKRVFVAGLGSGGSPIVMELAKLGVAQTLLDNDRLELGNISRHVAGIPDVGRYKTKVMAGLIQERNPYANTETYEVKIAWDTREIVRDLVRQCDLTICAVDDNEARAVLNKASVDANKPLIVAGAFRRAYGGQVLKVMPHEGPCYQCFLKAMPEQAQDQEISSAEHAERIAYSDRPVAIEPGLSVDIAPISLMVVKLAIQILLMGKPTTMRSLDDDLVAPWFLWLNRREHDTEYARLGPLACNLDGMRILRWYGIALERDEACPICGGFTDSIARAEGFTITRDDVQRFARQRECVMPASHVYLSPYRSAGPGPTFISVGRRWGRPRCCPSRMRTLGADVCRVQAWFGFAGTSV